MDNWQCFQCKESMLDDKFPVHYQGITRTIQGIKCPRCGAKYLTEDIVVKIVNRQEKALEDK
ncbi:hypothetical protein C4561_02735 [candidate division WWE3 bacterium]|jgi:YgiT-type zinc finger domain-containing protein|uniref:DUF7479 domain-containing protein n=1 Tax=candidate division WWE3 bacterium TaxID=2053526 RepID=A0A3A4ZDU3_UNCKA|nr:MAG: hypothetical protein C4561_02735 [candidate division WWE3 bacterium]